MFSTKVSLPDFPLELPDLIRLELEPEVGDVPAAVVFIGITAGATLIQDRKGWWKKQGGGGGAG